MHAISWMPCMSSVLRLLLFRKADGYLKVSSSVSNVWTSWTILIIKVAPIDLRQLEILNWKYYISHKNQFLLANRKIGNHCVNSEGLLFCSSLSISTFLQLFRNIAFYTNTVKYYNWIFKISRRLDYVDYRLVQSVILILFWNRPIDAFHN